MKKLANKFRGLEMRSITIRSCGVVRCISALSFPSTPSHFNFSPATFGKNGLFSRHMAD